MYNCCNNFTSCTCRVGYQHQPRLNLSTISFSLFSFSFLVHFFWGVWGSKHGTKDLYVVFLLMLPRTNVSFSPARRTTSFYRLVISSNPSNPSNPFIDDDLCSRTIIGVLVANASCGPATNCRFFFLAI